MSTTESKTIDNLLETVQLSVHYADGDEKILENQRDLYKSQLKELILQAKPENDCGSPLGEIGFDRGVSQYERNILASLGQPTEAND